MVQVGDFIQVIHKYDVVGTECLNVFYYEVESDTDPGRSVSNYLDEYKTQCIDPFLTTVTTSVTSMSLEAINLTDEVDFGVLAINENGTVVGDTIPAIWAANFTLPRINRATRNGSKRVSGFGEIRLANGVWDIAGATLASLQQYIPTVLTLNDYDGAGANSQWRGVIIGRTKNASGVYELDLTRTQPFGTPIVSLVPTTQRTRKT